MSGGGSAFVVADTKAAEVETAFDKDAVSEGRGASERFCPHLVVPQNHLCPRQPFVRGDGPNLRTRGVRWQKGCWLTPLCDILSALCVKDGLCSARLLFLFF